MDPLLLPQINQLKDSPEPLKQIVAAMFEVVVEVREDGKETKEQAKKTNGGLIETKARVTALENRPAVLGCPGKCNDISSQILTDILPRIEKIERPLSVVHTIKVQAIKLGITAGSILTLVFGFMVTPWGARVDAYFANRDAARVTAIEQAVKTVLAERDAAKAATASSSVSSQKKP